MTSKSLFFKRLKQDLGQRIWLPVVSFLLGFLCMEFPLISRLESYQRRPSVTPDKIREYLVNEFWISSNLIIMVTICMAVVAAISGFSYMQSAKKLDVYHSIPVKRHRLFVQQYAYGVVYYLVPLLIHVLICLGICGRHHVLAGTVVTQALWFLLVQFLMFLVIYSTVVLAVCLTGNAVITVLGAAVLLFYSMIIALLRTALMQTFFTTHYEANEFWNFPAFSPAHMLFKLFYNLTEDYEKYFRYSGQGWLYAGIFVMALIYGGLALWLYIKRPTEVAGKTMAFSFTEPVVKTMVVLPVSITMGYFFRAFFTYDNEFGWFLFGCIFGFAICCPLMEIIYRKDIKAVFRHPLQLLLNGVLVIGVVMVFKLDLVGYDTYVPAQSKVDSYAIAINMHDRIYVGNGYSTDYFMDMEIRDNESVRELVERGAEITRPIRTGEIMEEMNCTSMSVRYNLKNGKEVYRNYLINLGDEKSMQLLKNVLEDTQYKKAFYPILDETREENHVGVIMEYVTDQDDIPLSEQQMQRLLEAYREELMQLTFEELSTRYPVALMNLAILDEERDYGYKVYNTVSVEISEDGKYYREFKYSGTEGAYKIYPSFTKTIALLKEYGARMLTEIPLEEVQSISVEDYSYEKYDENGMWDKYVTVEYTKENGDEIKMAEILPGLTDYRFYPEFQWDETVMPDIDVRITLLRDDEERNESFRVKMGMLPEFVKDDIIKKAAQ